jgi:hypothetical protein
LATKLIGLGLPSLSSQDPSMEDLSEQTQDSNDDLSEGNSSEG